MNDSPATTRVLRADAARAEAARCLAAGGLVAFPTETVYGLGADATNGAPSRGSMRPRAGRRSIRSSPMSSIVRGADGWRALMPLPKRLAAAFWPGPLTLVLPKAADCAVAELATAGLDSIAVRVPAHPIARDLLAAFGRPVVAPSANRSGHVSPTRAAHVLADLRRPHRPHYRWRRDAGRRRVDHRRLPWRADAAASRRLAARGDRARARATARRAPAAAPTTTRRSRPACSPSHYAPRTRLRLDADARRARRSPARLRLGAAAGAERAMSMLNLSAARRSDRGGGQFVLASARARCGRRQRDRGHADAARGPRRGDQRPPCARGGAALNGKVCAVISDLSSDLSTKPEPDAP